MNTPTDSVRISIFDAEDTAKFLVQTEADDMDNWKLPGGKFNSTSESVLDAAARELFEELGLSGDSVGLRSVGKLVNDDGVSARYIFTAVAQASQLRPTPEVAELRWVTESDVPDGPNRSHMLTAVALARRSL